MDAISHPDTIADLVLERALSRESDDGRPRGSAYVRSPGADEGTIRPAYFSFHRSSASTLVSSGNTNANNNKNSLLSHKDHVIYTIAGNKNEHLHQVGNGKSTPKTPASTTTAASDGGFSFSAHLTSPKTAAQGAPFVVPTSTTLKSSDTPKVDLSPMFHARLKAAAAAEAYRVHSKESGKNASSGHGHSAAAVVVPQSGGKTPLKRPAATPAVVGISIESLAKRVRALSKDSEASDGLPAYSPRLTPRLTPRHGATTRGGPDTIVAEQGAKRQEFRQVLQDVLEEDPKVRTADMENRIISFLEKHDKNSKDKLHFSPEEIAEMKGWAPVSSKLLARTSLGARLNEYCGPSSGIVSPRSPADNVGSGRENNHFLHEQKNHHVDQQKKTLVPLVHTWKARIKNCISLSFQIEQLVFDKYASTHQNEKAIHKEEQNGVWRYVQDLRQLATVLRRDYNFDSVKEPLLSGKLAPAAFVSEFHAHPEIYQSPRLKRARETAEQEGLRQAKTGAEVTHPFLDRNMVCPNCNVDTGMGCRYNVVHYDAWGTWRADRTRSILAQCVKCGYEWSKDE